MTKRDAPFCLRLSREERVRLERDALGMSLAAYIKWRVFDPDTPPPRSRGKAPVADHKALAAVLASLGQTRLGSNINQLAHLANSGSLIVTPETQAELVMALRYIRDIRRLLLKALGQKPEDLR